MRRHSFGLALALALLGAPALAQPATQAEPGRAQTFAERALKAARIQAALARLAARRSENPAVKRYAEALVLELDGRAARLARLAGGEDAEPLAERAIEFALPQDIPFRTQELHRLRARRGAALDRQFLKAAIIGQENALRGYAAAAKSDNAELRALAEDALPRLGRQLGEARRLLADMEERRR
jgi:putative membrane protein